MPQSFSAVVVIILFIIPGFITDRIIGLTIPKAKRESTEIILTAITFSCINYAIFSWLILLMIFKGFPSRYQTWFIFSWLGILLLGPIFEGLTFNWLVNAELYRKLFNLLRLKNIRLIPKSWDYKFGKEEPCWILMTLKDGTKIGGFFGSDSFASSFPAEEDLYIEELWEIDEEGKFQQPVQGSGGCLVKRNEINFIEFFKLLRKEGENKND
jgi:hypothetical protein